MRDRREMRAGLALVALAVVCYGPAFRAGYIWDDGVVYANPLVLEPSGLARIWLAPAENVQEPHYWPLVYTTFWLEHRLWGGGPVGYHAGNILLHALCTWLAWRLLRRLEVPHAWLAAALFAVHPVHVESVAWIAERKDVLSGALYLAAALVYLRGRRPVLATVLFTLALLSKSIVVTLPAALALVHWWKDGRVTVAHLRRLAPLVVVAGLLTALDLLIFYQRSESEHLTLSLLERVLLAGRALVFYAQKLVWPHPLAALYPKWTLDPGSPAAWVPLFAVLALLAVVVRRAPRGVAAGLLYYALTLAPALGLLPHGFMAFAWVADRFQYLASLGPLALVGAGLGAAAARRPALRLAAGTLVVVLSVLTWRQSTHYEDHITLFRDNVEKYPHAWTARVQLYGGLARAGRHAEAVPHLEAALEQDVDERHTLLLELAATEIHLGRLEKAEGHIRAALELQPAYAEAHYELGRLRDRQGRRDEALAAYRRAVELRPELLDALPIPRAH